MGYDPEIIKISTYNRICSIHFAEEDLIKTPRGALTIKDNAIPTLHLGPNVQQRKLLLKKTLEGNETL